MSVQEIEKAITQLRGDELSQLLTWLEDSRSGPAESGARQPNYAMGETPTPKRRRPADDVRKLLAGFGQHTGDAFVPESVDMRELAYDGSVD